MFRKIISFIATFAVLLNSLGAPLTVIAQEITPEPTPVDTSTPVPEATLSPTEAPTDAPTPTEVATPTPEATVEPTPAADLTTPAPEASQPETQNTTSENTQSQAPPDSTSLTISPTAQPTATPQAPVEHGNVSTTVVESIDLSTINLLNSNVDIATVTTDKADYSPTSVVLITGTGLTAGKTYTLVISSTDEPAVTFSDSVTTDSSGTFTYAYQLDGNYRPDYSVFVKDGDIVVASTTFTDSLLCTVDVGGANDQPGQKDLTKMCFDRVPATKVLKFNWDEIVGGGNNTYDGCSLWDTDSDGKANFALCVSVLANASTDVMQFNGSTLYSCGDAETDRCSQQANVIAAPGTSCSTAQANDDPFPTGAAYPQDTVATCNINPANFGATPAVLLNVCSFPSGQPNSDPSDCVAQPTGGFITVVKQATPNNGTAFPFAITGGSTYSFSINGSGSSQRYSVANGTYSVAETVPGGWALDTASCIDTNNVGFGSKVGSAITGIVIDSGDDVTCTFADSIQNGTFVVHKTFTDPHSNSEITINISGTASGQGTTNGSGDATFSNLTPGTYSATAVEPTGYYQSATTCTNVSVTAGQTANCTITDSPILGTITVHKVIVGTTTAFSNFCFTLSPDPSKGQICANGSGDAVFSNVPSGSYTASETASAANYTQTNTTCNVAMVIASNGDSKSCTVTNTRNQGTIELKKVWSGTAGQTTLNIGTSNGAGDTDTQLTGTSGVAPLTTGQNTVNTGTYYVSETGGLTDYSSGLACTDNGSPVTPGANNSVSVTTSHAIICTFTNTRNQGKIELQKDFVGTPENVTIKIGTSQGGTEVDSDVLSADGTNGEHTVDTGTLYVSETLTTPSNYASALACFNDINHNNLVDQGDTTHTVNTGTGALTVGTSDDVICVFTNTRNTGSVKVNKLSDSDGNGTFETPNPQSFNWSLDGSGTNAMGSAVSGINTGSHNVNENSVANYHLVGWYYNSNQDTSCANPLSASLPASVSVTTGQTVEITICNARDTGTVKVHKDVVNPDGGAVVDTSHNFGVSLDGANEQTLTDGGMVTYSNVVTGSHSVTESTIPGDYSLDSITPGSPISVVSGQTTDVYVVNKQKKATITVVKDVHLANGSDTSDNHTFYVTLNGTKKPFAEGSNATFSVNPGEYGVIEDSDANYTYVSDNGPKTVTSNGSATITVINEQNVASISGYKFMADGVTPIEGWGIQLLNCAFDFTGCVAGVSTTTDVGGFYSFSNLITGFYQVVEDLVSIYTPVGVISYNETVTPGATIIDQDFSNFKNINIKVCKLEDLDGNPETTNDQVVLPGWEMQLYGNTDPVGEPQNTGKDGCTTFENLGPLHDYAVTETLKDGWYNLTPLSHDFGKVQDGIDQIYTFINSQLATLGDTIYQDSNSNTTQDAGEPGIAGISVNLYKDDGDGIFEPGTDDPFIDTQTTNASGQYEFTGLQAGSYWVDVVDSTIPFGFTLTTVNDPYFVDPLLPGANFVDADFGYVPPTKEISIEKSNDASNTTAGSTVTYTLTIHNGGNISLSDVTVTDIIPGGFTYVAGSTTGVTTSDPTVNGGQLTWNIGTLGAGSSATLHYQARLASDLTDGAYVNFATCTSSFGRQIENEFRLLDTVDCNTATSTVTLDSGVNYGGNLAGQVLGISTELPATGSPTELMIFALGVLGIGLFLNGYNKKHNAKN